MSKELIEALEYFNEPERWYGAAGRFPYHDEQLGNLDVIYHSTHQSKPLSLSNLADVSSLSLMRYKIDSDIILHLSAILPSLTNCDHLAIWHPLNDGNMEILLPNLSSMKSLKWLNLAGTDITNNELALLSKVIPELDNLHSLNLRCNHLDNYGLLALVPTIKQTKLHELKLYGNNIHKPWKFDFDDTNCYTFGAETDVDNFINELQALLGNEYTPACDA